MCRAWPVLFILASNVGQASASDGGAGRPYDFQVLLKVGAHRLLTPTFRQQLAAELRDGMRSALGPIADVHVLEADNDKRGNGAWIEPELVSGSAVAGGVKRHFVAVDFVGGQYAIRARQYDGTTGLAGPLVRRAQTSDPRFVGRQILRFLQEDFGAVGTVVRVDGARVWLQLLSGEVSGTDLAPWVPSKSVFAIVRARDGAAGEQVESTYLRSVAGPRDGQVECELLSRYLNPLRHWPQGTYRAVRLGTTRAAVRLRVTDPNGLPQGGLLIRVSPTGFKATDEVREQGTVRDGFFESAERLDGLACVRVSAGDQPIADIPVPILDDRVVELRVPSAAADEAREGVESDARREHRALHDILRRLREQNRQLSTLLKETKNRDALDRLQSALETLDIELQRHSGEISRLRAEGPKVRANIAQTLTHCDQCLKDIRDVRARLLEVESKLKSDVAAQTTPETQDKRDSVSALLRKVELHLEAAEYEEAIETYKQILSQTGEREDVRKKLNDLEAAWKTKGPEHEDARRFAYSVWPRIASFEDVRNRLPLAREKFEACKTQRDRLTAKKLYLVATDQATKIVLDEFENLKSSDADVAALLSRQIDKAKQDLSALITDIKAFLESAAP